MISARNTEYLSSSGNVQNDCTEWINDEFSGEILTISNEAEHKEVDDTESVNSDVDFLEIVPHSEAEEFHDGQCMYLDDTDNFQDDALEYVAGYIIRKTHLENCESNLNTFTWVNQKSNGSLKNHLMNFFPPLNISIWLSRV